MGTGGVEGVGKSGQSRRKPGEKPWEFFERLDKKRAAIDPDYNAPGIVTVHGGEDGGTTRSTGYNMEELRKRKRV